MLNGQHRKAPMKLLLLIFTLTLGLQAQSAAATPPLEQAVVLTPKPSPHPRINGPKIFGVRPGSPFLFTVAATGDRPMRFAAANLPTGLQINAANGQTTGVLPTRGEYVVTLIASNALAVAERK